MPTLLLQLLQLLIIFIFMLPSSRAALLPNPEVINSTKAPPEGVAISPSLYSEDSSIVSMFLPSSPSSSSPSISIQDSLQLAAAGADAYPYPFTFLQVTSLPRRPWTFLASSSSGNRLLAACNATRSSLPGLYVSADYGMSWTGVTGKTNFFKLIYS